MPDSHPYHGIDTPLSIAARLTQTRAQQFSRAGFSTVRDILFFFPAKHLDRSTVLSSDAVFLLLEDGYDGEVTVFGKVIEKQRVKMKGREILSIFFRDASGIFEAVFFHAIPVFYNIFKEGNYYALSAKPQFTKRGALQFVHPDFDSIAADDSAQFFNTGKIIPFYRISKEMREENITVFHVRKVIASLLEEYSDSIPETLPAETVRIHGLFPLSETIRVMHFPPESTALHSARKRLKFEELFYLHVLTGIKQQTLRSRAKGIPFIVQPKLLTPFANSLPFRFTEAQKKVLREISADMQQPVPMNRLLQGDVGSGKTIVALMAMLIAVDNGYRALFMAPTELLADQQAKKTDQFLQPLRELFPEEPLGVALLIGGQKKKERAAEIAAIQNGTKRIIFGTHALLEENVTFENVGLVVIDEQHRFGVRQRAQLIQKGVAPDVLVMSATPIPRTLSMTLYGDLDVSVIDMQPKDRKPITTVLRNDNELPGIYAGIVKKCAEGYQAFVVYPLVEESEKLVLKAAQTYYEELRKTFFKDVRVGLLHGKMSWQEKESVMQSFAAHEFDVLIATTVIEVGIDIPNANIMVINDAHRFGLSQLHQLRGRVGRGAQQAYCILVSSPKIIASAHRFNGDIRNASLALLTTMKSAIRLFTMANSNDGFHIAEIDLSLRGPGDILGWQQSGLPPFRFASLSEDGLLIQETHAAAASILLADPALTRGENRCVKQYLETTLAERLRLALTA